MVARRRRRASGRPRRQGRLLLLLRLLLWLLRPAPSSNNVDRSGVHPVVERAAREPTLPRCVAKHEGNEVYRDECVVHWSSQGRSPNCLLCSTEYRTFAQEVGYHMM